MQYSTDIHTTFSHLEGKDTYVRMLFVTTVLTLTVQSFNTFIPQKLLKATTAPSISIKLADDIDHWTDYCWGLNGKSE